MVKKMNINGNKHFIDMFDFIDFMHYQWNDYHVA